MDGHSTRTRRVWHAPPRDRPRSVCSGSYVDEFEDEELPAVGFVEAVNLVNVRVVQCGLANKFLIHLRPRSRSGLQV